MNYKNDEYAIREIDELGLPKIKKRNNIDETNDFSPAEASNKIDDLFNILNQADDYVPLLGDLCDLLERYPQDVENCVITHNSLPVLLDLIRCGNFEIEKCALETLFLIIKNSPCFTDEVIEYTQQFLENLRNEVLCYDSFKLMLQIQETVKDYFDNLVSGQYKFISVISSLTSSPNQDMTLLYFQLLNFTLKNVSIDILNNEDENEGRRYSEIAALTLERFLSSQNANLLAIIIRGLSIIVDRCIYNWKKLFSVNITEKLVFILEHSLKIDEDGLCRHAMVPLLREYLSYIRISDHPHHQTILHNIIALMHSPNNPDEKFSDILLGLSENENELQLIVNDSKFNDMYNDLEPCSFKTKDNLICLLAKLMSSDPHTATLMPNFNLLFQNIADMVIQVSQSHQYILLKGIYKILSLDMNHLSTLDDAESLHNDLQSIIDENSKPELCELINQIFDLTEDEEEDLIITMP